MTQFGITKHEGSGDFTISFSKPQFEEFLKSLTTTPREEVFRIVSGFNVSKANIRHIIEKLTHQIRTQNNLVSDEYSFSCLLENKHEITWRTYEQFFHTADVFKEKVVRLSITMTFMIGFNRGGEQKVERQVVQLNFDTRPAGIVMVRIMSTELSWPPTVFQLIENEVSALVPEDVGKIENEPLIWRWFIKSLIGKTLTSRAIGSIGEFSSNFISWTSSRAKFYAILTTAQITMLLVMLKFAKDKPLYNSETGLFERGNFQQYVDAIGLDQTVALAEKSKILYDYDFTDWAKGHSPVEYSLLQIVDLVGSVGAALGIVSALVIIICHRKAAELLIGMSGRIFLTNDTIPPSPRIEKNIGIGEGILVGLLVTAIWVGATQFISFFS